MVFVDLDSSFYFFLYSSVTFSSSIHLQIAKIIVFFFCYPILNELIHQIFEKRTLMMNNNLLMVLSMIFLELEEVKVKIINNTFLKKNITHILMNKNRYYLIHFRYFAQ